MVEPAKDYADQPDTEEQVLSRWQKLKTWFEIAKTGRAIIMFVKVLIWGTAGTAVVDVATDGDLLNTAATEVGIVDPTFRPTQYVDHDHDWTSHSHDHYHEHSHDWEMPRHDHEMPLHEHGDKPHKHADHIHIDHTHAPVDVPEGIEATIDQKIKEALPENHDALH